MFMTNITYRDFKNASRKKSLDLFSGFFKYMFERGQNVTVPIGIITYCTDDDNTKFVMGPLPNSVSGLTRVRDALFKIHPEGSIRFLNFTTLGVVSDDYDDEPVPSIVSMVCDREIWEVDHAEIDMPFNNRMEMPNGTDHAFNISDISADDFDITIVSEWESLGSIGETHSSIAELFMEKMR
jgi:hypothetical protein